MSTESACVPKNLAPEGRALWRAVASQVAEDSLELDQRELKLLEAACCEQDMLSRIEVALANAPLTVKGAQNQLVAHPLIGEARRSRAQIKSLLGAIGLEDRPWSSVAAGHAQPRPRPAPLPCLASTAELGAFEMARVAGGGRRVIPGLRDALVALERRFDARFCMSPSRRPVGGADALRPLSAGTR